jgi:transcriptional regulator of acetoin/glycerol metabolism
MANESENHITLTLEEVERRHILAVLQLTNGNKQQASRLLGIDRRTLYRKLESYNTSA